MKKANVTILASIFIMALVAAGVGAGTMAFFSSTVTVPVGHFDVGTLDIDFVSSSYTTGKLNPGDVFELRADFKNVGTSDAMYVYMHFKDLVCTEGENPDSEWPGDINYLSTKIVLVKIEDWSDTIGSWVTTDLSDAAIANSWLTTWGVPEGAQRDGSISLRDIVDYGEPGGFSAKTSFKIHTGDPPKSGPWLSAGHTGAIKMTFKLQEDTLNYAQGDDCAFKIDFIASNTAVGALLDASIG
jgi:predicted ribosomally synthesized peptide with SipW-like signal peptide